MGKTRDLFKKIRDTKGTFHAKMSSIKGRNGMDLTEAEDIKKRWQEYTEELYKKDPEILVVPREKTPTGAAARGNPGDAPVLGATAHLLTFYDLTVSA